MEKKRQLYLKSDVIFSADVFEELVKVSIDKFDIISSILC